MTKAPDEPTPPKPKDYSALLGGVSVLAVVKLTVDRFLDVAERLVKAVERNAEATEKLASTVSADKLSSGDKGDPYVRIDGKVRTRPGV